MIGLLHTAQILNTTTLSEKAVGRTGENSFIVIPVSTVASVHVTVAQCTYNPRLSSGANKGVTYPIS
jgi:hypothetical protein